MTTDIAPWRLKQLFVLRVGQAPVSIQKDPSINGVFVFTYVSYAKQYERAKKGDGLP